MGADELVPVLQKVDLFHGLDTKVLRRIAATGREETFEPRETVGDYFGELSLIDGEPRSADVVAGQEGLTTFAVSKWQFEILLEDHPGVAISMLHVLAARLRAAERSGR